MSDALTIAETATTTIDVTHNQTVSYWTTALGVDEHSLRTAVAEVGTSAQDIRSHLGRP